MEISVLPCHIHTFARSALANCKPIGQWIISIRNIHHSEYSIRVLNINPVKLWSCYPVSVHVVLFGKCNVPLIFHVPNTEKLIGLKSNQLPAKSKTLPIQIKRCLGLLRITSKHRAQSKTHEMEKRFRYYAARIRDFEYTRLQIVCSI